MLLLRHVGEIRVPQERLQVRTEVLQADVHAGAVDLSLQRAVPFGARLDGLPLRERLWRNVAIEQRELHRSQHDGPHLPAARGASARFNTPRVPLCSHLTASRAQNWTSAEANGYTLLPVDNEKPVRFDLITAWFFGLSAIFHAIPVIVGPFDRWAWAYWKCIDNAFSYWR